MRRLYYEIFESVRIAFSQIRANKLRSALTALGVIIGSLIIGSSLVVTTGATPRLFGLPALGVVGYLISALLGLRVVWDIIRHGRHQ